MGYFATLDIKIDIKKEDLVKFIIEDIWKRHIILPFGKLENQGENGILFETMTVFIDIADKDDIEYFAEQYGMHLNYRMYIELFQKAQNRYKEVMKFLIKMLETYSGDCIFSLNGTTLLMRRDGRIVIDRTQMKKYSDLPYQDLPGIYREDDIDD